MEYYSLMLNKQRKYKIIYMVVLDYVKKYIHKKKDQKKYTKMLQWRLYVVKLKGLLFPFMYMNVSIFLVCIAFIIRKNYQQEKNGTFLSSESSSAIMTNYLHNVKVTLNGGQNEFCLAYNRAEKKYTVCIVSNNRFYLRGNCGVLLSCER